MRRVTRSSSELLVVGILLTASADDLRLRRSTLDPGTAAPARMLVPHHYFWKGAKRVRGLRLQSPTGGVIDETYLVG
jgi:DMSO/TMAO reductase YedYZ molybdopterin-dependent catalytic subunit